MTDSASPSADPSLTPPASPLYMWIARILLFVAIATAAYLLYSSLQGGPVAGCRGDGGCNEVLQSHFARWWKIPVSAPALAAYITLLLLSFARPTPARQALTLALCLTILGAAAWFICLQYFVIHSMCKFCLVAHGCGIWSALTLRPRMKAKSAWVVQGVTLAILFLAVLVGGQKLLPTQTALWEKGGKLTAVHVGGDAPKIVMFDGNLVLDLKAVPLFGSPDAPHVAVVLFDPTCHYCKELHRQLATQRMRYGKSLAIVMLPMPLDSRCNPAIAKESSVNACEYSKLALAVWHADRTQYETYVDYLMGFAEPPGVDAATERAEALVGKAPLQEALGSAWAAEQLHTDVELFHASRKASNNGSMPQMMMGDMLMQGLPNAEELQTNLAKFMKE